MIRQQVSIGRDEKAGTHPTRHAALFRLCTTSTWTLLRRSRTTGRLKVWPKEMTKHFVGVLSLRPLTIPRDFRRCTNIDHCGFGLLNDGCEIRQRVCAPLRRHLIARTDSDHDSQHECPCDLTHAPSRLIERKRILSLHDVWTPHKTFMS